MCEGSNRTVTKCESCNAEQSVNNDEQVLTEQVLGEGVQFERLRRIIVYLVGTVDRWNNGKKAELNDRVKHEQLYSYDTQ